MLMRGAEGRDDKFHILKRFLSCGFSVVDQTGEQDEARGLFSSRSRSRERREERGERSRGGEGEEVHLPSRNISACSRSKAS